MFIPLYACMHISGYSFLLSICVHPAFQMAYSVEQGAGEQVFNNLWGPEKEPYR